MKKIIIIMQFIGMMAHYSCSSHRIDREDYRHLAFKEFINEHGDANFFRKLYFNTIYDIPDTLTSRDYRWRYLKDNPSLRKYIVKAIMENKTVNLMTIYEFYLSQPDLLEKTKIVSSAPDEIIIGYKEYLNRDGTKITGGQVWIFKHGFLWESGVI